MSGDDTASDRAPGEPTTVPGAGVRARIRANPPLHLVYRGLVFVAGLLLMAIGVALAALPGPLTIPPVLLGLWIWASEFRFARRLFDSFKARADDAWAHAKAHRVSSSIVTVGGLVLAGVAIWAVARFELVARARELVGL